MALELTVIEKTELIEDAIKEWATSMTPASIGKYSKTTSDLDVSNALKKIYNRKWYKTVSDDFYIYCARRFGWYPERADYFLNYKEHSENKTSLTHPPEKNKPSYVYFIESENRIKIGVTGNVDKRFSALKTGSPVMLNLIGYINGTKTKEKELHQLFSPLWSHGEWFKKNDDLMKYINEVCYE